MGVYGQVKEIIINESKWEDGLEKLSEDYKVTKQNLGTFRFVIKYSPHKEPDVTRQLFI